MPVCTHHLYETHLPTACSHTLTDHPPTTARTKELLCEDTEDQTEHLHEPTDGSRVRRDQLLVQVLENGIKRRSLTTPLHLRLHARSKQQNSYRATENGTGQ